MGTDNDITTIFEQIKPLTISIAQNPKEKQLKLLCMTVEKISDSHLQQIQQYCMFPLGLLLKRHLEVKENVLLSGVECMSCILNRTIITEEPMFRDLFTSLCLVISQWEHQSKPEGVLLASLKLLKLLVEKTQLRGARGIHELEFLPACGHGVSLLLSLAEKHRSRDVQCAALTTLMALTACNVTDRERRPFLGAYVASFLPGISMTLTRVVTGDVKQGHRVIELALECWCNVVALVLDDQYVPRDKEPLPTKNVRPELCRLLVTRDESWLDQTTERLAMLVTKLTTVCSHQHWAVRRALLQWARGLLTYCWSSLSRCRRPILDVCLTLLNDDYTEVTSLSHMVIDQVRARDVTAVVTLLEDHVYELCTSLPRLVRMQGEEANIATLKKLLAYFQHLGSDLSPVMKCSVHVRRIYQSLLQLVEVDVSGVRLVEERNSMCSATSILTDDVMSSLPGKPRPNFRYLYEDSVYQIVLRICHTLALYGDVDLLLDLCVESMHTSSSMRKEAIFLANQFIIGARHSRSKEDLDILVRLLVSEYLQPYLLDLEFDDDFNAASGEQRRTNDMLVATKTSFQSKSLRQLNSDVQQICLVLTGLAECAKVVGRSFQLHLMGALYPVLVCLASTNHVISQTAHIVLADLAHACQYRTLNELVCGNADYLVNSISLRMRHFTRDRRAPVVLRVMLDICSDHTLLNYVRDVIDEMLDCLDDHHVELASSFLYVMRALVRAVARWYPNTDPQTKDAKCTATSDQPQTSPDVNDRLLSYVTEYGRQKLISDTLHVDDLDPSPGDTAGDETDLDPSPGETAGDEVDDMEEKKPEVPLHISVVKSVLERCVHLMSVSEARLRLLVLDITATGLVCLHQYTDELLPIAHLVWAPLVHRFRDEEQLVIVKSFELLCVMTDVCEDFLTQRVRKQIIPQLSQFLTKQAEISEKSSMMYRQTVAYKSQLVILRQLGPLAVKLKLSDRYVDLLYQSVKPYLSSAQPLPLQQASKECLKLLYSLEADLIWLRLMSLCPSANPDDAFAQIQSTKSNQVYQDNVLSLWTELTIS